MLKNVGQFEIPMHYLIFDKSRKSMQDLHKVFNGFILRDLLFEFEIGTQISFIAVLQN